MKLGLNKFYELVESFERLPTIGKKSAQRLAYHIIMQDNSIGVKLAHSIENAINSVRRCSRCGAMSEHEICEICLDETRDHTILCIVQNAKDIFIIEESKQFNGRYFVLSSLDETIVSELITFIQRNETKEILFALSPSVSNDALILFIEDKLYDYNITFHKIAQGVPTGVSLENVDLLSLSKAIESKVNTKSNIT